MTLTATSTLPEVAIAVGDHLRHCGITAVLTGGACVSVYTDGSYLSKDADFVIQASTTDTGMRVPQKRGVPRSVSGVDDASVAASSRGRSATRGAVARLIGISSAGSRRAACERDPRPARCRWRGGRDAVARLARAAAGHEVIRPVRSDRPPTAQASAPGPRVPAESHPAGPESPPGHSRARSARFAR